MASNLDERERDRLPSPEQLRELYLLIGGYRVSQAIRVVIELGIPDLLASGPQASADLARATSTHAGALHRVLRLLAGVGIVAEVVPGQFALTPLGAGLRADAPASMCSTALMHLDRAKWQSWGDLMHSVRTGDTAFELVHGIGTFDYMERHPDTEEIFQQAMTSNTRRSGTAITRAYDFTGIQRLVDVGGGHGLFLATILGAYPAMRGVLFDRPEVVVGAQVALQEAGVAERCEVVSGDFFVEVPAKGDAYVLRQIIHDWDDARAIKILESCRRAMRETGKVLVVESALTPDCQESLPTLHLDLEMLVNYGGSQRTEAEYSTLFAAAGLRLSAVVPLGDAARFSVFEAVRA